MKGKTALFTALALAMGAHSDAFAQKSDTEMKADARAMEAACAKDAERFGCAGKELGDGLLRCMNKYRVKHPNSRYSPICRAAIKEMRAEMKE